MKHRKHTLPADIERTSMEIIAAELAQRGIQLPPEHAAVIRRVIHTTADFDYAETLTFTLGAVQKGVQALASGTVIVTDTNMARAGLSKPALTKLGGAAYCFMADPEVAAAAKEAGTTRRWPPCERPLGNIPAQCWRWATPRRHCWSSAICWNTACVRR